MKNIFSTSMYKILKKHFKTNISLLYCSILVSIAFQHCFITACNIFVIHLFIRDSIKLMYPSIIWTRICVSWGCTMRESEDFVGDICCGL